VLGGMFLLVSGNECGVYESLNIFIQSAWSDWCVCVCVCVYVFEHLIDRGAALGVFTIVCHASLSVKAVCVCVCVCARSPQHTNISPIKQLINPRHTRIRN